MRDHLNRNSYRILEDESGIAKKTACTIVNTVTDNLIHSNELTKLFNPQNYCGTLLIDGKYVPVKEVNGKRLPGLVPRSAKRRGRTKKGLVIIPCIDYLTHDIPIYGISLSENICDIEKIFQELKAIGYPLKALVCDESMGQIAEIAKRFFPKVVIQICCTHYSKSIERCFISDGARRTYNSLQKKLDSLGESFLIPTRNYDRKRAIELTNRMANLEYEYGYLWEVQDLFSELFWEIQTEKELIEWENKFNTQIGLMDLKHYPYRKRIEDRYADYYKKRELITASIMHPELNIPRTTNLIEGLNSTTFEIRFSSIRGFEKDKYAEKYINAMILKYRFHKFTDCKGKFKNLNKKSPLQIACPKNNFGFIFNKSDWISFCRKLK